MKHHTFYDLLSKYVCIREMMMSIQLKRMYRDTDKTVQSLVLVADFCTMRWRMRLQ